MHYSIQVLMSVQTAKATLFFQTCIMAVMLSSATYSFAQAPEGKRGGLNQFSIFTGKVLPNGVDGAPEIFSLTGLRYSRAFSDKGSGYWEVGGLAGNGSGVEWTGLFASLRMDVPVETLIGFAYLGLDYTRYSGVGVDSDQSGGAHVGGGLMSLIGGDTYFRFDMKLNSKPGTSLLFTLGLTFGF